MTFELVELSHLSSLLLRNIMFIFYGKFLQQLKPCFVISHWTQSWISTGGIYLRENDFELLYIDPHGVITVWMIDRTLSSAVFSASTNGRTQFPRFFLPFPGNNAQEYTPSNGGNIFDAGQKIGAKLMTLAGCSARRNRQSKWANGGRPLTWKTPHDREANKSSESSLSCLTNRADSFTNCAYIFVQLRHVSALKNPDFYSSLLGSGEDVDIFFFASFRIWWQFVGSSYRMV